MNATYSLRHEEIPHQRPPRMLPPTLEPKQDRGGWYAYAAAIVMGVFLSYLLAGLIVALLTS